MSALDAPGGPGGKPRACQIRRGLKRPIDMPLNYLTSFPVSRLSPGSRSGRPARVWGQRGIDELVHGSRHATLPPEPGRGTVQRLELEATPAFEIPRHGGLGARREEIDPRELRGHDAALESDAVSAPDRLHFFHHSLHQAARFGRASNDTDRQARERGETGKPADEDELFPE